MHLTAPGCIYHQSSITFESRTQYRLQNRGSRREYIISYGCAFPATVIVLHGINHGTVNESLLTIQSPRCIALQYELIYLYIYIYTYDFWSFSEAKLLQKEEKNEAFQEDMREHSHHCIQDDDAMTVHKERIVSPRLAATKKLPGVTVGAMLSKTRLWVCVDDMASLGAN